MEMLEERKEKNDLVKGINLEIQLKYENQDQEKSFKKKQIPGIPWRSSG